MSIIELMDKQILVCIYKKCLYITIKRNGTLAYLHRALRITVLSNKSGNKDMNEYDMY